MNNQINPNKTQTKPSESAKNIKSILKNLNQKV